MKVAKMLPWAVFLIAFVFIAGCGAKPETVERNHNNSTTNVTSAAANHDPAANDSEPVEDGFIGYVVKKEENRILVVEPKLQDFSSTGGNGHFYDAIWFGNAPDDVEIGQQVEVWVDGGINQSYPGQASAKKVSSMEVQHDGALLTEAEVVRKALSSEEAADLHAPAIVSVTFDNDAALWTVKIDHTGEGHEPFLVEVPDRK